MTFSGINISFCFVIKLQDLPESYRHTIWCLYDTGNFCSLINTVFYCEHFYEEEKIEKIIRKNHH